MNFKHYIDENVPSAWVPALQRYAEINPERFNDIGIALGLGYSIEHGMYYRGPSIIENSVGPIHGFSAFSIESAEYVLDKLSPGMFSRWENLREATTEAALGRAIDEIRAEVFELPDGTLFIENFVELDHAGRFHPQEFGKLILQKIHDEIMPEFLTSRFEGVSNS